MVQESLIGQHHAPSEYQQLKDRILFACDITEEMILKPNRVFIIPAKRDLHPLDGEFRPKPISRPRGWPDMITVFLRSLTKHWNGKIIAVMASGYVGDGAAALYGIQRSWRNNFSAETQDRLSA